MTPRNQSLEHKARVVHLPDTLQAGDVGVAVAFEDGLVEAGVGEHAGVKWSVCTQRFARSL